MCVRVCERHIYAECVGAWFMGRGLLCQRCPLQVGLNIAQVFRTIPTVDDKKTLQAFTYHNHDRAIRHMVLQYILGNMR